jgi:hypothetical protein
LKEKSAGEDARNRWPVTGAQPAGEPPELAKTLGREHAQLAVSEVERGLRRLDKPGALALGDSEAILHDLDLAGARQRLGQLEEILDP